MNVNNNQWPNLSALWTIYKVLVDNTIELVVIRLEVLVKLIGIGLTNKKDYVIGTMNEKENDVCCMEEVEIKPDYDHKLLSSSDFKLIIEKNTVKARSGIYIRNGIDIRQRPHLEGVDSGLIEVDLDLDKKFRIINVC